MAERIRDRVKAATSVANVLLCATHTHTGPQTHEHMLGFGHASPEYMERLVATAVATVEKASREPARALMRHKRSPPLGLCINRRERVNADAGHANKKPKHDALWFERAGATTLGQRPEGPTVPHADALHFVSAGDPSTTLATLLTFACHPVCCGKLQEQSADYLGACRRVVEDATGGALAIFVTGCAGDVNPLERGGGLAAAAKLGQRLGDALVECLQPSLHDRSPRGVGSRDQPASLRFEATSVDAPLEPLPAEAEALAFLAEQEA